MRESEYAKLKALFEEAGKTIPEPKRTYSIVSSNTQTTGHNKIQAFLLIKKYKSQNQQVTLGGFDEHYNTLMKAISKNYKQFYTNFQNVTAQQKKIAALCSREIKRSLSKTSKTNPVLKSKRINKELNTSLKRTSREEVVKQKKEEKEEELKRKREEEEKEELRQKRKFNYLMSQTEAFASFFLNKKAKPCDESEDTTAAIKAAQSQLEHLKEFDGCAERIQKCEQYEYQTVQQPELLKAKLKEHQLKGLSWLVNLYNQGINGILADDMGLGKTIQSISLLCYLAETEKIPGPFLIITPSSTLHNWSSEFSRFVPSFKVLNYWGNIQERKDMRKNLKKCNVVVTSYQIAVSDESIISKIKWQYMILDEAQAIKSVSSQRWKILLGFKSRNRLLLTGTPIQNSMQELWSLLHFIMPTLFDSLTEFSEWFSKEIENKTKVEEEQISKLHTILKPFMLRRHKSDIKDEIGSKEIINVPCEMSNRQKLLYDEILNSKLDYENILMQLKKVCNHPDLFEKLEPSTSLCFSVAGENGVVGFRSHFKRFIPPVALFENDSSKAIPRRSIEIKVKRAQEYICDSKYDDLCYEIERRRLKIENMIYRFRFVHEKVFEKQLTTNIDKDRDINSPACYRDLITESEMDRFIHVPPLNTFISDSGKLSQIDVLLKRLREEGHRVLIYFQMTRMMDLFEEYLVKREYNYLRLDGSSKISHRKELVDQWQNKDDVFVFILSTRAGGVGINLTAADTVIFYDSDWNPTVDQQAMDRVHRLGQTKDVTVYRLITQNSIEEKVMERANKKEEVQKIVIQGNVFSYLDE